MLNQTSTKYVSLTTYAKPCDIDSILVKKADLIEHAFHILHDKDENETHSHIVLGLKRSRIPQEIVSWFKNCVDDNGKKVNTFAEPIISCDGIIDYLTHSGEDQKLKHQYKEEDIKVPFGNLEAFRELNTERDIRKEAKAKKEEKADECESLIDDIISGVSLREMARKYGKDFMKNRKSYNEFAAMVIMEEEGDFEKAFRIMGNGFNQHIEEVKHLAAREAYTKGEYKTAAALCHLLQSEVDSGATYLQKTLDIMRIYKKGIFDN